MTTVADKIVVTKHSEPSVVRLRSGKIPLAARVAVTAVLVATAAILGVRAFWFYEYSPWTRDGRINAYVVDSAPEISGQVVDVAVQDNQFVHRGDVLYRIDARDYQAALDRAQAELDMARQQMALQEENAIRRAKLRTGDVSEEEKQTYAINAGVAYANVESAQATL